MKKGYWIGNVIEIKMKKDGITMTKYFQIEEKQKMNKLEIIYQCLRSAKGKIKGSDLMFAAVVEFNSLQDIDCHNSKEYQEALNELGDNPEKLL